MPDDPFFSLSGYHFALAAAGVIVILARWLPRLVSGREPVSAPLMIVLAGLAWAFVPVLPQIPDPRETPHLWEVVSEITVIAALFGSGMRIDTLGPWRKWMPTLRMLAIAMPLTIVSIAVLGIWGMGLTLAAAILLGAVLAPTDPVLAADVQVGPPQEGSEEPVRFSLTTEAALNDGLAFPFVYLAILVALSNAPFADWGADWFFRDMLYRITLGAVLGWVGGWVLGQILFRFPRDAPLAKTESGVIAVAGVLLCYGSTELAEGYGFIAVAVMGLALRRVEETHTFHRALHDFTESIEHTLTAVLLIGLGAVLPQLLADLSWGDVAFALALILVLRPVAGWIALLGSPLSKPERGIVAVYGVRGIGSIYYLAYAASHVEFVNEARLWSIVALVILLSTILHGFTVARAMDKVTHAP